MGKYIVVDNGSFKAIEQISNNEPLNTVLKEPQKTYSGNTYTLANNNVSISWLDDYVSNGRYKCLTIRYKKTKLLELNTVQKIQNVIDILNRFKNITQEELETIYQKALKEEKSDLEVEVEKLNVKKKQALKEIEKFKSIITKINEVSDLFKDLENGIYSNQDE